MHASANAFRIPAALINVARTVDTTRIIIHETGHEPAGVDAEVITPAVVAPIL